MIPPPPRSTLFPYTTLFRSEGFKGVRMSDMLAVIKDRDPGEDEFYQAVKEVIDTVKPVLDQNPEYRKDAVFERLIEPERVITFRVPWKEIGRAHV